MIEIKDVYFKYLNSPTHILEDFSLNISKGEIVGIIGPTGSGKSTICYLFNGLIPHHFKGSFQGSVIADGKDTTQFPVEQLSETIGYMLQEPSFQIASAYVESEIAFGMENLGVPVEEMEKRITAFLEKLGISHLRERSTSTLSEGEKQRVVLASILAMKPDILVLDESTSMIDSTSKKELIKILKDLKEKEEKTIILIDHDLDFISKLVDRVILVNHGKIMANGLPTEVLTDVELLEQNGLVPPTLTYLFHEFKVNDLPLDIIPTTYDEATKILTSWLK